MTREDLVRKKLGEIEAFLSQLQSHGRPDLIAVDVVQRRFVEHTLQVAIQAALDAASHIVSDDRLGEPKTNAELFTVLARHDWLSEDLAETMTDVVGFRNIVVHGYADVDLDIVRDVAENRIGDLLEFVEQIRSRLNER